MMTVILAGGLATRLYPVTKTVPKSMIDVAGKPFIYHQIELLKRNNIEKIVLCAGYLGEEIKNFLHNGEKLGVSINYSFDGEKLLGTGGALRKALHLLDDVFFILYGDSYLDIDFKPVGDYFLSHNKPGLMTVFKNNNSWDRSNIIYKNGKIIKYDKEDISEEMNYIDYGLGILRKDSLEYIPENEVYDLSLLYKKLIGREEMLGFEVKKRFYEIGTPGGLRETEEYILGVKSE